uniref:Uncharacterized protein n=1 Tax=Knipowitschia caucasica TaxID=637954 RepID=A0AAV2KKI5_KNICA
MCTVHSIDSESIFFKRKHADRRDATRAEATEIGNGTRIQVDGGVPSVLNPALMALMVLNVVLVAAVVVLVRLVCIYRRTQLTGRESSRGSSQAEDEVTYAGVNVVPSSASCRSTSVTTVLYSEVRSRQDRS